MAFRRRVYRFFLILVAAFVLVWLRVLQLQVVQGEHWRSEAQAKRQRLLEIDAPRGRILDAGGRVLARDVPIFQLTLVGWEWLNRVRERCSGCGSVYFRSLDSTPRGRPCPCGEPGAHYVPLPLPDPAPLEAALGLEPGELSRRAEERIAEIDRIARRVAGRLEAEGRPEFLTSDVEKLTRRDLLFRPYLVVPRVAEDVVRLVELDDDGSFRGFQVRTDLRRDYPEGGPASQLLGYVSVVEDWDELERLRERYENHVTLDTRIGRAGLERSYEDLLLGQLGWERQGRDDDGEFTVVVDEERPRRGRDLHLALEAEACLEAERILQHWGHEAGYYPRAQPSGGFVALDADTGEILAWGEMPRFEVQRDLQDLFANAKLDAAAEFDAERGQWLLPDGAGPPAGETVASWRARLSKPAPLTLSRVSRVAVEPGSTFKVFTGLGLLEGLHHLPPGSHLPYDHYFECVGRSERPGCHHHRGVDFVGALEVSCNRYFALSLRDSGNWNVYRRTVPRLLQHLGFGEPSGVDVWGEGAGILLNDYADFDPRQVAAAAVDAVRQARGLDAGQMVLRIGPRLPGQVAGRDPRRLHDLLVKLLDAAAVVVGPGRVVLNLDARKAEKRLIDLAFGIVAQPHPDGPAPQPVDVAGLRRAAAPMGGRLAADVRPPGIVTLDLTLTYHEAVGRAPGEPPMILPDDGRMVAIGQGPVTVTPLQMVRAVAVIANGGRRVTPHAGVRAGDTPLRFPVVDLGLDPEDLDLVRAGMREAVIGPEGTARRAEWHRVPATVYGKTGTAQVGSWWTPGGRADDELGPWHHWFVGFAEARGKRTIAFACVLHARTEKAASHTAVNAACDFLAWWYRDGPGR